MGSLEMTGTAAPLSIAGRGSRPRRRAARRRAAGVAGLAGARGLACLALLFAFLLSGCAGNPAPQAAPPLAQAANPAQVERDQIFSLLAYAVVQLDWQAQGAAEPRGYNIGSVLVDKNACVVYWGLNSVGLAKNKTQHGEVRLMTCYMDRKREAGQPLPGANLKDYAIYTTLEPCAMCSGMMVLQSVLRTVYGQKDPSFGDALERLAFDGERCGGYPPYPRPVQSIGSTLEQRRRLDALFKDYCATQPSCSITDFLATPAAKQVYDDAVAALRSYRPRYPENGAVAQAAQRFFAGLAGVTPQIACPDLPEPACPRSPR